MTIRILSEPAAAPELLHLLATDLGVCEVCFDSEAICAIRFVDDAKRSSEQQSLPEDWLAAIRAAARGEVIRCEVPVRLSGTPFQLKVWQAIARIPHGKTVDYSQLAHTAGVPNAIRAVGSACASNPVALLIPCHRVLRKDGALGGYAWGIERKRRLLHAETKKPLA